MSWPHSAWWRGLLACLRSNPRWRNHHLPIGNRLSAPQQAEGWTMEGVPFCVGRE